MEREGNARQPSQTIISNKEYDLRQHTHSEQQSSKGKSSSQLMLRSVPTEMVVLVLLHTADRTQHQIEQKIHISTARHPPIDVHRSSSIVHRPSFIVHPMSSPLVSTPYPPAATHRSHRHIHVSTHTHTTGERERERERERGREGEREGETTIADPTTHEHTYRPVTITRRFSNIPSLLTGCIVHQHRQQLLQLQYKHQHQEHRGSMKTSCSPDIVQHLNSY